MDHLTTATAGAALLNPWWLNFLNEVHPVGSIVLQILGATWLCMQMYYKWKKGH